MSSELDKLIATLEAQEPVKKRKHGPPKKDPWEVQPQKVADWKSRNVIGKTGTGWWVIYHCNYNDETVEYISKDKEEFYEIDDARMLAGTGNEKLPYYQHNNESGTTLDVNALAEEEVL